LPSTKNKIWESRDREEKVLKDSWVILFLKKAKKLNILTWMLKIYCIGSCENQFKLDENATSHDLPL